MEIVRRSVVDARRRGARRTLAAAACAAAVVLGAQHLATAGLRQSASDSAPPKDPLARIAEAEHALAAERREEALLHLWAARDGLAGLTGSSRDAAAGALDVLLPKADPLFDERTKVERNVARTLLGVARAYRGRKWSSAAARVAAEALVFDAAAVQKDFPQQSDASKGRGGRTSDGATQLDSADPFADLGRLSVVGDWQARDGALFTPELTDASVWYLTQRELEDHQIGLSVDFGDRTAMFGILVGARGPEDYYIVDSEFTQGSGSVRTRLWLWRAGELRQLVTGEIDVGRKGMPARIEVSIRGAQVVARVDGTQMIAHTVDAPVRGKLGFYVSTASRYRGSMAIRDLRITPTPEGPAAAAQPASSDEQLQRQVAAALAEAEELIARKQPEPAAERLRAARTSALRITAPTLRKSLVTEVDQLLDSTDPLHARRQKAFADAAAALQPLAERYASLGLHHAAACVTGWMERLDPEGQSERAAAYRYRSSSSSDR